MAGDIDQLQQDAAQGDAEYGTPCLVCGAPIIGGYGHDEGCMARQPDAIRLGRICNECGAQLPSESEPGSPILMAHLRDEHPWRFEQRDHFAEAMGLSVQSGRENGHFR